MTLAEQREKLIAAMKVMVTLGCGCDKCSMDVLAAISAAGFSIVETEVTEEMLDAGLSAQLKEMLAVNTTEASIAAAGFKAMLAAGDLARKETGE